MVPDFSLPTAIPFKEALKKGVTQTYTPVPMSLDEVAFLQYTGGTTGVSKGAMLTHRNLVSNMEQIRVWVKPLLKEAKRSHLRLPLYHIFALTLHALSLVKYGAHNILITNPKDVPGLIKELAKYPFTVSSGVNTLFNAMMNNPDFSKLDFQN